MNADISGGNSAQQGVRQGMQRHIRIGMAFQFFPIGDFNAAKPDTFAGLEGVNIKTIASADIPERFEDMPLRRRHIRRSGDLEIEGFPLNY